MRMHFLSSRGSSSQSRSLQGEQHRWTRAAAAARRTAEASLVQSGDPLTADAATSHAAATSQAVAATTAAGAVAAVIAAAASSAVSTSYTTVMPTRCSAQLAR